MTLLVLFWYVYFSCNKIELVRSKLGIALSAVFTVLGAVTMSLGMSGVSLNIHSKVRTIHKLRGTMEIFPGFCDITDRQNGLDARFV